MLCSAIGWTHREGEAKILLQIFVKGETRYIINESSFCVLKAFSPCLIFCVCEPIWVKVALSSWGINNKTSLLFLRCFFKKSVLCVIAWNLCQDMYLHTVYCLSHVILDGWLSSCFANSYLIIIIIHLYSFYLFIFYFLNIRLSYDQFGAKREKTEHIFVNFLFLHKFSRVQTKLVSWEGGVVLHLNLW